MKKNQPKPGDFQREVAQSREKNNPDERLIGDDHDYDDEDRKFGHVRLIPDDEDDDDDEIFGYDDEY